MAVIGIVASLHSAALPHTHALPGSGQSRNIVPILHEHLLVKPSAAPNTARWTAFLGPIIIIADG